LNYEQDWGQNPIKAATFSKMQTNAVIVNVVRAALIEEAALYAVPTSKRIARAVIDTWYYCFGEKGALHAVQIAVSRTRPANHAAARFSSDQNFNPPTLPSDCRQSQSLGARRDAD
jgi:hypothetical protein